MTEEDKQQLEFHMSSILALLYRTKTVEFKGEVPLVDDGGELLVGGNFRIVMWPYDDEGIWPWEKTNNPGGGNG